MPDRWQGKHRRACALPDGEANFVTISNDQGWIARIQFNGELDIETEKRLAELFALSVDYEVEKNGPIKSPR